MSWEVVKTDHCDVNTDHGGVKTDHGDVKTDHGDVNTGIDDTGDASVGQHHMCTGRPPPSNTAYYLSVFYQGGRIYIQTKYKILKTNDIVVHLGDDGTDNNTTEMEIDDDSPPYRLVDNINGLPPDSIMAMPPEHDLSTVFLLLKFGVLISNLGIWWIFTDDVARFISNLKLGIETEYKITDGNLMIENGSVADWTKRTVKLLQLCLFLDNQMLMKALISMIRTELRAGFNPPVDIDDLRLKRYKYSNSFFS